MIQLYIYIHTYTYIIHSWEDPLEGEWLPTPVFLPGEFYGQRSLVGYSPWSQRQTQLSDFHFISCLYILFFRFFPHIGHYKILSAI